MPIVVAGGANKINEAVINADIRIDSAASATSLAVADSEITGKIYAPSPASPSGTGEFLTAHDSRLFAVEVAGIGTRSCWFGGVRISSHFHFTDVGELTATGMNFDSPVNTNVVFLDGCSNVYIQGHMKQAGQHGVRALDCTVCEFDLLMRHPGSTTNDTYDGYSLEGTTSRTTIRGSIRGNASGNKPSYGIDVAATCSDIHVCAVIDNAVDGEVNDPGSVVTYCGGSAFDVSQVTTASFTGEIAIYTGLHLMVWPFPVEILSVRPTLGVAPTGDDAEFDILVGDGVTQSSILTGPISVLDGDNIGAKEVPTTPAVPEGDALTADITQIGSTTPGEALTVIVEWRRTG